MIRPAPYDLEHCHALLPGSRRPACQRADIAALDRPMVESVPERPEFGQGMRPPAPTALSQPYRFGREECHGWYQALADARCCDISWRRCSYQCRRLGSAFRIPGWL